MCTADLGADRRVTRTARRVPSGVAPEIVAPPAAVNDDRLLHDAHVPAWEPRYRRFAPVERAIDLALLVPGAVLSLPLARVAAFAVAIARTGTPFHGHTRTGLHGRRFRMWSPQTRHREAERRLKRHLATDERARDEWRTTSCSAATPASFPG